MVQNMVLSGAAMFVGGTAAAVQPFDSRDDMIWSRRQRG
jgi:hypothetical protein